MVSACNVVYLNAVASYLLPDIFLIGVPRGLEFSACFWNVDKKWAAHCMSNAFSLIFASKMAIFMT